MSDYVPKLLDKQFDDKLTSYPPLLRRLLLLRGITDAEQAEYFLHPDWERDIHDPFLMFDMEKAVDRVFDAMRHKEKIVLWSDYDMDGIPGAVVLYDFFTMVGYTEVVHYTPHRNKEGFGLNKGGIDTLVGEGVKLMITIDCGIADREMVAYANEHGVDVIITDHHLPPHEAPSAYAILNPKQEQCDYPEKMLAGAGVAFKFVQALIASLDGIEEVKRPVNGWEKWLLDMVGMATVADMVPLVGENRALAHFGMVVLRKSRRLGLHALLKRARANQRTLTEDDVAFTIAPRVNAASRMGHAGEAFTLLTATDTLLAEEKARELDTINTKRKTLVATMKRETKRRLTKRGSLQSVIVMGHPDWKPSLVGLVASSVAQEYNRPVFLWGKEGGDTIKGSCRSDGVCNLFELMQAVEGRFIEYGGHAFSGGFSLDAGEVHTLEMALAEAYKKQGVGNLKQEKFVDEILTIDAVSWDTYREVQQLAPFGEGNPKPLFKFEQVPLVQVRMFGKGNEHLELTFAKSDGSRVKAIEFFTSVEEKDFTDCATLTFVAYIEASYFMGRKELRLRLVDTL